MIDQTEILLECAKHLWSYRAELKSVWPTPNTLDALRFAVTEVGEAIDADLRLNQEYARNRDKDLSVEDELADALMMLITALGEDEPLFYGGKPEPITLEAIMLEVSLATFCHRVDRDAGQLYASGDAWHDYVRTATDMIVSYPGMDLPNRLIARLERIKAKRLETSMVAWQELDRPTMGLLIGESGGLRMADIDGDALLSQAGSHE